jgi:hypothetical protein
MEWLLLDCREILGIAYILPLLFTIQRSVLMLKENFGNFFHLRLIQSITMLLESLRPHLFDSLQFP